jgi:hypothetical protein
MNLQVPEALYKKLKSAAEEEGLTVEDFMGMALIEYYNIFRKSWRIK